METFFMALSNRPEIIDTADGHSLSNSDSSDLGSNWQVRFWMIFSGQTLSLIGSGLTQFVLLWWITGTTGSLAALATAGVVALLPQALISPLGGIFADRYSRRVLMIATDMISALCMSILIVLFLTERVELWHIYWMMFVRSAMQAFQTPAASASVAMLVPRSFLPRAAGLSQAMQGIILVAAAPLGALAISMIPLGWALSIDVVTALLGCLPLLRYRIPQASNSNRTGLSTLRSEFRDGLHLIWSHPGLRRLYALMGVVVLVIMPSFTLVPLLVKEHFGGGAPHVAFIDAMAGAGMLVGGVVVALFAPRQPVTWILWGFATSCFALALTGLMPADRFNIAAVCWMVSGMSFILGDAPMTALLQSSIPNHLQGRGLSLLNMVMGLAAPLGLALTTPLGELIGVRWLFVVTGVLGGLICLMGFFSTAVRRLEDGTHY
ncbi:MFS transporter [Pseudomonas coronafaciens]|nr:MFS transporter [Pseudomonas coronafaciens]RMM80713.1 Macrolide efflux protein [Pseudomonas coronafaciens pv. striafaciens]